jgi:hypothetical protein
VNISLPSVKKGRRDIEGERIRFDLCEIRIGGQLERELLRWIVEHVDAGMRFDVILPVFKIRCLRETHGIDFQIQSLGAGMIAVKFEPPEFRDALSFIFFVGIPVEILFAAWAPAVEIKSPIGKIAVIADGLVRDLDFDDIPPIVDLRPAEPDAVPAVVPVPGIIEQPAVGTHARGGDSKLISRLPIVERVEHNRDDISLRLIEQAGQTLHVRPIVIANHETIKRIGRGEHLCHGAM